MKTFTKICSSIALVFTLSIGVMAQVPQGFNFQAAATAPDGTPLSSVEIGVQIEVVKGTEEGDVVYTETHTVTTNSVGLFQIIIGEGSPAESNDFTTINWGNDNYFVGFGVDITDTGTYESLGKTRLLSVPYALLAQNVVNGSGTGTLETSLEFNTAEPDSAFFVNVEGPRSGSAIIASASTDSTNVGGELIANSTAGNPNLQVGAYGEATGEGTGTHIGMYGGAFGQESLSGDGGRRYGLYGSARSTGRENIGGFGIARGAGDGEIVALGDEFASGEFNVGGFNLGLSGYSHDNLNGNIGIRGYVYGDQGGRENRAVSAEAVATATGQNVGVQAFVNSSQTKNIGYQALMFDAGSGVTSETNEGLFVDISNSASVRNQGGTLLVQGTSPDNLGLDIRVSGGTNSNIGLIVNAETAAELNGNVTMNGNLVVDGFIEHTGTITQTSDVRYKTNITDLSGALENTLALRGVSYNWIDENKTQDLQIGVIAQEVEEIYPEFVHTDEEGMKSVNYSQMVTVLIEAVKELNSKIEVLEAENSELQAQINDIETMKAQISKLMTLISVETAQDSFSSDK